MMSRRAPDTSWPDQPGLVPGIRPSTRPTILRRSWPQEMPGTSPGMTRRVGRSDGSHPQGRRRPQPAPPLRPLGGAPVRTRTGSAERDRASVLIERFPCLCTTLPFRHGRACPRPSIRPRTREEAWRREMPGYPEPVRASPGMTRWVGRSGVGHEEGRTAGPEHATACRAVWRVGKRAELAPAVEGNERGEMRAGYRRYGPPGASRRGPSLTQRTMADAGACSAYVSSVVHN